ncbi:MAG: NADP-dependent malic enzyme [Alphaproteobacteria bacterium]|nr:NADP-dependent malic enzyme [Alphaproteobacteria bacterium]
MLDDFDAMALEYHEFPRAGKISVEPTKRLQNQRDLALAYSPGVAAACNAIVESPSNAASLTVRANMVAVLTNGTAVLGLGAIGPLAAKPVMEGKAVLFKKFAGIDVFDIEVNETDPDKLTDIVVALEPTFGGINLEDIKAPECFIVEKKCQERMNIPVFHDDQHGTAITVAAAVKNSLLLVGKTIGEVRLVTSGAGAAALACLDLLIAMGLNKNNVFVTDIAGVVYKGRKESMDSYNSAYAIETEARSLGDVIEGTDIFLGLSVANTLLPEMVIRMARDPIILALANPIPEIWPEEVRKVRQDAIVATGRSDYSNQVNNVLCFPFIFRGALDTGAKSINQEMKLASVEAISALARLEPSDAVQQAYADQDLRFGRDYILPKPFDPRLIGTVAPAVAKAAMDSGVATRPIIDFDEYRRKLSQFVFRSGQTMRPIFDRACNDIKKVVFAEGEDESVLQAVRIVVDDKIAKPILVGGRERIEQSLKKLNIHLDLDREVQVIDPTDASRHEDATNIYYDLLKRHGVTPEMASLTVRTQHTAIAALAILSGEADALVCGVYGSFQNHLSYLREIVGLRDGIRDCAALCCLISSVGTVFFADTDVRHDPDAREIAEIAILASAAVSRFGVKPKVGLVSHSSFGSSERLSALKMSSAYKFVRQLSPNLDVEGEMHADAALSTIIRGRIFPHSEMRGPANVLIMPNIDAAHIAFTTAKVLTEGLSIGPMLLGMKQPCHIVSSSITVRGLVNMAAIAAVDAQYHDSEQSLLTLPLS